MKTINDFFKYIILEYKYSPKGKITMPFGPFYGLICGDALSNWHCTIVWPSGPREPPRLTFHVPRPDDWSERFWCSTNHHRPSPRPMFHHLVWSEWIWSPTKLHFNTIKNVSLKPFSKMVATHQTVAVWAKTVIVVGGRWIDKLSRKKTIVECYMV